jgi:chorismate-pyruvate lyase
MSDAKASAEDRTIIKQLDLDYNNADQASDAKRLSGFLAEHFIVRAVAPKSVNLLVSPHDAATLPELQSIGVRRISLGVDPYMHALAATQAAAEKLVGGDLTALASDIGFGHIIELIRGEFSRGVPAMQRSLSSQLPASDKENA